MKQQSNILEHVLNKAKQHIQAGAVFNGVFDLDSTLFDVHPRVLQILNDFATDNAMRSRFPETAQILSKISTLKHTYKFKDILISLGLLNQSEEFYKTIYDFWNTRFFSNDYLKYDVPYEGAIDFVNDLYKTGAHITYLTGRDIPRMGLGTEEVLNFWKFPIGPRTHMALKPDKNIEDAIFKRDYLMALPRENTEIWFFENEPVNIDLVLREVNHVNVVYFESVHKEKAEPPGDHIPRIKSFSRNMKA